VKKVKYHQHKTNKGHLTKKVTLSNTPEKLQRQHIAALSSFIVDVRLHRIFL